MPDGAYGKIRQENYEDFCRVGERARAEIPIAKNEAKRVENKEHVRDETKKHLRSNAGVSLFIYGDTPIR